LAELLRSIHFLDFGFWILDFGLVVSASLYPFIKRIEYIKSKIRNPKSEIYNPITVHHQYEFFPQAESG